MNSTDGQTTDADELRRRAEERLEHQTPDREDLRRDLETAMLVHELEVHQIELEMQNDELQRAQVGLEAARERYFDLYDLAPIGYLVLSRKGLIQESNLTAAALLGIDRRALVNQPLSRFIVAEDQRSHRLCRNEIFETDVSQVSELRMVRGDGSQFWARLETLSVHGPDGEPACRAMLSDITERKNFEGEQRRANDSLEAAHRKIQLLLEREQLLARVDYLTGVCNRRCFFELAAREFSAAVRYHRPLAILMFDTDNLKQINDAFGHAAGDKMIVGVAKAAAAEIRTVDVLARYGGDEFVVLLTQTSAQQALAVAERIRTSASSLRKKNAKGTFGITLSIGIAEMWLEPLDEHVEDVVQRADKALYEAKAKGRNHTVTYPGDLQSAAT